MTNQSTQQKEVTRLTEKEKIITVREKITMPKGIKTAKQFNEWRDSFKDRGLHLDVTMKKRRQFYPFHLTLSEYTENKIHYLISDQCSTGYCLIENLNRVFNFYVDNENYSSEWEGLPKWATRVLSSKNEAI